MRKKDNFLDGQSTLLFDKYILSRGANSKIYTVDINPESTKVCKEVVSKNVEINTDDSIRYLNNLCNFFLKNKTKVSMFYLDSFDVLDGNYARNYKMVTQFGDYFDHIKDLIVY